MNNVNHNIIDGQIAAFVNKNHQANVDYKPMFISNNYEEGRKVISTIEDELSSCSEFFISVAFITMGGITPLLQTFKELERKGIPGRILTTDYQNFSDPAAIRKLAELKNITIKMYQTGKSDDGFHTKGYIFKHADLYRMIIGSSNLTLNALTKNKEWNTKIISTRDGEFADDLLEEFTALWESEYSAAFDDFIDAYTTYYNVVKEQRKIAQNAVVPSIEQYKLRPNAMQLGFIHNLEMIRQEGASKALLISATGTGKTYASAFAMREEKMKKVLFLVHREQIAKQAIESYKKVFGTTRTFGLLSGNSKDFDVDYLFSTMQMMAKEDIMHRFAKDAFDTIIIDEAHRTGASSYQNIMHYFTPKLWLGMTASPERTDAFDVYAAFDHNIAYEIRLQQALEENLLCPFHYFGITDLEIDGVTVDEETGLRDFNRLTCEARVQYIIEQMEYYGHSGDCVKGLVFCSSKKEAIALSEKFNEHGYRTMPLTGDDSQEKREDAIERLVLDGGSEKLDYLFTVDIFNEGVDIPEVNQVIMLRPTESPIVFVQQLGRGLRKASQKEYVVILDFIGNYKNNFMIPIALSGDRSYNKDNIRRYVLEGERIIPGSSTIHFDEISRKRIFAAIDTANFSDIKLIKENYKNLKNKLGHIPALKDFDEYGEMDVLRIFDNDRLGSYYKFLVKYEKEYTIRLSEKEEKVVEFISKKLASGKRIHELALLRRILGYQRGIFKLWENDMKVKYGIRMKEKTIKNVVNVMTNEFPAGTGKNTYADCVFLKKDSDGEYTTSDEFRSMLLNKDFYDIVQELIDFGILRYEQNYNRRYKETSFVLYQKYTYEDVCRLLEWENNEVPLNIGGYKFDKTTNTLPIFINYDKEDDIQDTIKYEDHFVNPSRLIHISKQGRFKSSDDVQNFLHAQERGIDVELFVRKNKNDKISKEFYFLGTMKATGNAEEFIMANTDKTAVEIEWDLETPVREDIFEYIVNN